MDYEYEAFDIEQIRLLLERGNVIWREHAIKRLRERKLTKDDVRSAIGNGEIIEERPYDLPTPCCLILGVNTKGRFIHVSCGVLDEMVYIISVYYPDVNRWEADFATRKR